MWWWSGVIAYRLPLYRYKKDWKSEVDLYADMSSRTQCWIILDTDSIDGQIRVDIRKKGKSKTESMQYISTIYVAVNDRDIG